ncbi:MAG: hypothetical protein HC822_06210 [Oscillochloris sp.]|nr:hypothetical protein [Oscillochloris sp.]
MRPYLGVNVNAASVAEIHQRGLLEEGEQLLALFDGVLLDENRRRVGGLALTDFVALTDQRLITWARGFFSDTVDGLPWQDVDVARTENWDPWHGRVMIALRLPAVEAPRRRIVVQGVTQEQPSTERVIVNTFDYMPVDDVKVMAEMISWLGEQVTAGTNSEELVAAFAELFPAVDHPAPRSFFQIEPMPPAEIEEPVAPVEEPRRRWWQRSSNTSAPQGQSASNLITAYEQQRQGMPSNTNSAPAAPQPLPPAGMPVMPEQPNMYEVSRSLRLFLEAPRRLARGLRRAGEVVNGAGELVNGMQDPLVRRNAMRGLYQVAAQQEADGGPLAPVGPVVRAAVRFAEPLQEEQATPTRRIQVRPSSTRRSPSTVLQEAAANGELNGEHSDAEGEKRPVRRSVSIRRVEPPAEDASEADGPAVPAVETEKPVAEPPRIPVRRIAIGRSEATPAPVSMNGNGHHPEDV